MSDTETATTGMSGWELRDDRSAVLWLDGRAHRLRPPRMGEFRRIKEDVHAAHETLAKVIADAMDRQQHILDASRSGDLDLDDAKRQVVEIQQQLTDAPRREHWALLQQAIALLCVTPLPPGDDLPPWLEWRADTELADLIKHWTTCPPHLGVVPQ